MEVYGKEKWSEKRRFGSQNLNKMQKQACQK